MCEQVAATSIQERRITSSRSFGRSLEPAIDDLQAHMSKESEMGGARIFGLKLLLEGTCAGK